VASPEKALLDLIHLTPGGARAGFLQELRLDVHTGFDHDRLSMLSESSARPKLIRAADCLRRILPTHTAVA
jgi:hypothetical protein